MCDQTNSVKDLGEKEEADYDPIYKGRLELHKRLNSLSLEALCSFIKEKVVLVNQASGELNLAREILSQKLGLYIQPEEGYINSPRRKF